MTTSLFTLILSEYPAALSLYLTAYQSLLWNRIAGRYLVARLGPVPEGSLSHVEIAGEQLPLYYELPPHFDREAAIPLPNHRAIYADPDLAAVVAQVL